MLHGDLTCIPSCCFIWFGNHCRANVKETKRGCNQTKGAHYEREEYPTRIACCLKDDGTKDHCANAFGGSGFKEIGTTTSAVTDIVTNEVCDHRRVAGIVFRDVRLNFSFALRKGWATEEDLLRIEQATSSTNLSAEDLKHFDRRNKITCALGWEEFQVAHTSSIDLISDDRILLCTDGIHDNLTDNEIEELLRKGPVAASAQQLVQSACQRSQEQQRRSKPDDMSAIVVLYQAPS